MRIVPLLRPLLVALSLGAVLGAAPGCKKTPPIEAEVTTEGSVEIPEAIVEENDNGSVTWSIAPDGNVKGLLKTPDGKPITKNVTGELVWVGPSGETKVPVAVEPKTGYLIGTGPALQDDFTPINYKLNVENKPWGGTLHVPRGGTLELHNSAKASIGIVPEGKVGPNGGVIQVIGDDRVEVVAEKSTGQVRVYFLDPDYKVIKGPDRQVKIAIGGESPEIVVLEPEPKVGLFFVGRLKTKVDPVRVSVAVTHHDVSRAAIVGWAPTTHLVVGTRAPRVRLLVASGWAAPDVDVHVRAPSPVVVVHEEFDDDVRVDVRHRGHGHGHGHGHAVVGAGAGVSVGVGVHVAVPRPPPPPSLHVGVGVGVHAGAGVRAGAGAGVHAGGRRH
jgi:hypothetical protein